MSVSTSRLSYTDCFTLFEAAQADPLGARMPFATHAEANTYRLRMNTARAIDRKDNMAMYQIDHPLHGRSGFDKYVMRIKMVEKQWYLYVEPYTTPDFENSIQSLSEVAECTSNSGDEPLPLNSESQSQPTTSDGLSDNSTTPERPPTTPSFRRSL